MKNPGPAPPNVVYMTVLVFLILHLGFGLLFSLNTTFVPLLDKYGHDRSQTSIVQSLFIGMGLGLGAVSGALIDKYGLFRMSIVSAILSPLGFIVSFFATSLQFLYVSIGIISGSGLALNCILCIGTILRTYNGKTLALSLSIVYSAPGLGSTVYPYLIDLFLTNYGLSGTWLLIGGLQMNTWLLPVLIYAHRDIFKVQYDDEDDDDESITASNNLSEIGEESDSENENSQANGNTNGDTKASIKQDENISTVSERVTNKSKDATNQLGEHVSSFPAHDEIVNGKNNTQVEHDKHSSHHHSHHHHETHELRNLWKIVTNKPALFIIIGTSAVISALNGYMNLLFDIADYKLFSNSQTLLLFIPYAACNTVSRILTGLIKQRKGISLYIFPITTISGGVIAQFINHYSTGYGPFMVGISLIGLSNGGTISSAILLCAKLVGPERATLSAGVIQTFVGVVSTASSPLFGYIRDETGSYTLAIFLAASMYFIGLVAYVASFIFRNHARRKAAKTADDDLPELPVEMPPPGGRMRERRLSIAEMIVGDPRRSSIHVFHGKANF